MKKVYKVCVEDMEARTHYHENWTREQLIDEYNRKNTLYPYTLKKFDTYEEAKKFYDEEAKTLLRPYEAPVSVGRVITYQVLFIDEVEVDDDGEEQSWTTTDITATPLEYDGED